MSYRKGMDYVKNVVNPIRDVAPRDTLRGLREDWGHFQEDVVLLEGEIHYTRKPVSATLCVSWTPHLIVLVGELALHECCQPRRIYQSCATLNQRDPKCA